jgi:hypothetical protein
MSKKLVDGLNHCSNSDYHADRKYLSSSVLKTILVSLEAYKTQYIDGIAKVFGNRNALDLGSLIHSLILEPELVNESYNFFPGFRKAGNDYENFIANLAPERVNLPVISGAQNAEAQKLMAAYYRNKVALKVMSSVVCEQTICGTLHGVPIKVRFDAVDVEAGIIWDVKTTAWPGEVESFKQTMADLNYPLSGALYCAMAEQYYGKPFRFGYIVISKKDPVSCHVYLTSKATAAAGDLQVKKACAKYLKAKETNVWTEPKERVIFIPGDEILEV